MPDHLDLPVTADWILLQEFSKNVDAYYNSLHLSRAPAEGGKLIPWDFDLAFGQPIVTSPPRPMAGFDNEESSGWIWHRTIFARALTQTDSLRALLAPRWRELREGALSDSAVMDRIDGYQSNLEPEAIAENFALWPIEVRDFSIIYSAYSAYDVTSFEDEVAIFRDWTQRRLLWMDDNIDTYPDPL